MTDIAISYATARRTEALDVADQLRAAGRSAWVDDQSERDPSLTSIGVVVGQPHWTAISQAIDDATVLLVLDGPAWRASSYCRDEHAHAMSRGKRIAVIAVEPADPAGAPRATWPVDGLADLLARFDDDRDVVQAHDRLLQASLTPEGRPRRSRARLLGDVRTVERAPASAGVTVTEPMAAFAATVVAAARRRRATRIAMATVLVVTMIALTATALVARSAGLDDRRAARADAARQESLRLASDARRAETTSDRERLAAEAVGQSRTVEALAAERSVASASVGLRRYRHPYGPAYTVDITDDGRTVVLGTGDNQVGHGLARLDLDTGEVGPRVLVQSSAIPWMTDVSPDGSWAVFASPSRTELSLVSLDTAKQDPVLTGFTAFRLGADGSLWWAEPDGSIHRMADVTEPDQRERIGRVAGHVTAMTVDDDGDGLAVMLEGEEALRLDVTTSSGASDVEVVERLSLFPGVATGHGADDGDAEFAPDLLMQCGSSLVAVRGSTWAVATEDGIERDDLLDPAILSSDSWAPGPGCVGDAAVAITIRPPAWTAPDDAPLPVDLERDEDASGLYPFGSDRSGDHLVVARDSGIVDVFALDAQPTEDPWGTAVRSVPLPGGALVVTVEDEVWWRGSDRRRTKVGSLPGDPGVAIGVGVPVGERAVLGTDTGIAVFDRSGSLGSLDLDVTPTAAARHGAGVLLAGGHDITRIDDLDHLDGASTITVDALEEREELWGLASRGAEVVYATTSLGRVLAVDLGDGSVEAEADAGPALSPVGVVATTSDGSARILTYGSDGIVRAYGPSLEVADVAAHPGAGRSLTTSPDGSKVLAGTEGGRLFVIDPMTLEEEQPLTDGLLLPEGYRFTEDGHTVVGVRVLRTGTDEQGEITWRSRLQELPIDSS